jgi:hypothetical protein
MSASELATRVHEALGVDREKFDARVDREVEELKRELHAGTFDNPQAIVGLEYEFYAANVETDALERVPRRLLEFIGFEKELGLHNAEMQTTPQPLSPYGLRATEAEVQAKLAAAQGEVTNEGMTLVSDGMWTVPPIGESASSYLTSSVEQDSVRLATNMSDSVRYHAMANTDFGAEMRLDLPHVSLDAETVMAESLITSIQPHYQVPSAEDLPEHFRYALRVAGPLVALSVNSPFFPPDLYDVDGETVLADCSMENRIGVFESVLNPDDNPKVAFPGDVASLDEAVDRIAADRTVVPMLQPDGDQFHDRFAHFRHTHGTYWRWVRPVFDGPTRQAANARIEFRPIPGQPTVRDSVAFMAAFAGLMESLPRREHPVHKLTWTTAEENFYTAAHNGLNGDLSWLTRDGESTTDTQIIYNELLDYARDGLQLRGLDERECDYYLKPLETRVTAGVTPARWKYNRVAASVNRGIPFTEAVWEMQSAYIDHQSESLVEGCFTDWL